MASFHADGRASVVAGELNLQEIESAACIMMTPPASMVGPDAQAMLAQASAVITRLYTSPHVHSACISLLAGSSLPTARFFALQTLANFARSEAYSGAGEDVRAYTRASLLQWTRAACPLLAREPAYVRNKLALALAMLVAADYPERWPSAFDELIGVLAGDASTLELLMRILLVIQEEVVAPRVTRSSVIKDAMRSSANAALADVWLRTLTSFAARSHRLCALVLKSMAAFVEWVDIRLVTQAGMVDLLLNMLLLRTLPVDAASGMVSPSGTRVAVHPSLTSGAAQVVHAMLMKGMDVTARVTLMHSLRLDRIIATVAASPSMLTPTDDEAAAAEDVEFEDSGLALCDLLAIMGVNLIEAGDATAVLASQELCSVAASLLRALTSLLLTLLATQDAAVCGRLLPFFTEMAAVIGREARALTAQSAAPSGASPPLSALTSPASPAMTVAAPSAAAPSRAREKPARALDARPAGVSFIDYLPALLDAVAIRYTYPHDFRFDADDDDEQNVRDLRDGLKTVFRTVSKACPEAVLAHMVASPHMLGGDQVAALQSGASPWQRSEVVLSLLYYYGEASSNAGALIRTGSGALFMVLLTVMVAALPTAVPAGGAAAAPHHSVLLRYYECVERYTSLFVPRPDFLPLVLSAMLGATGLRHALPAVRARTCYLLMRTVKSLVRSDGSGRALEPYCDSILSAVSDLLPVPFVSKEALAAAVAGHQPSRRGGGDACAGEDTSRRVRVPSFDGVLKTSTSGGTRGSSGLGADDQQFLFEMVGILLGAPWMLQDKKIGYTHAAMTPLCEQMEAGLAQLAAIASGASGSWSPDFVAEVSLWIVRNLNALAHMTKGFGSVAAVEPLALVLERAMSGALRAIAMLPTQHAVRNTALFILHRMVECLESRLVPHLDVIFSMVLVAPTKDALVEALTFVNQCMLKFRGDVVPFLCAHLLPLVGRVLDFLPEIDVAALPAPASTTSNAQLLPLLMPPRLVLKTSASDVSLDGGSPAVPRLPPPSASPTPTDDSRSRTDLQRGFVALFNSMASHGLAASILLHETVAPRKWDIIAHVAAQVGLVSDLTIAKAVLQFIGHLTRSWLPVAGVATAPGAAPAPAPAAPASAPHRAVAAPPSHITLAPEGSPVPPAVRLELAAFLMSHVMPMTLALGRVPAFDDRDYQAQVCVAEAITLHATVLLHVTALLLPPGSVIPPLPAPIAIGVDLPSRLLDAGAAALQARAPDEAGGATMQKLAAYVDAVTRTCNASATAPSLLSGDKEVRVAFTALCMLGRPANAAARRNAAPSAVTAGLTNGVHR